ncbi:MAG: BON domain-containing protein [Gammaproteobacteria bacterium]|nr:BON domain-containing protein [Gammaproteobacteria bacterium]NNK97886.1 BON domain-containing protein [Xanthomonadales bacterium]
MQGSSKNSWAGRPGKAKALFSILLLLMLILTACSNSPRRTTGTVLNDQKLEFDVISSIRSNPNFSEADHIKVEVHQGVVLLAGETVSEANRTLATELAEESRLTERVVNDLKVGERAGFGGKLDNSWLTNKVNSKLLTKNPISGNDVSRIKVVSSQNTVYLMGMVTREEGDAVAEVVRNIRGVERVVKIFDYVD